MVIWLQILNQPFHSCHAFLFSHEIFCLSHAVSFLLLLKDYPLNSRHLLSLTQLELQDWILLRLSCAQDYVLLTH
jgi:hypothetical protein